MSGPMTYDVNGIARRGYYRKRFAEKLAIPSDLRQAVEKFGFFIIHPGYEQRWIDDFLQKEFWEIPPERPVHLIGTPTPIAETKWGTLFYGDIILTHMLRHRFRRFRITVGTLTNREKGIEKALIFTEMEYNASTLDITPSSLAKVLKKGHSVILMMSGEWVAYKHAFEERMREGMKDVVLYIMKRRRASRGFETLKLSC